MAARSKLIGWHRRSQIELNKKISKFDSLREREREVERGACDGWVRGGGVEWGVGGMLVRPAQTEGS